MDEKHDRDMPSREMIGRQSHRDRKRQRKEQQKRMRGSATERQQESPGSEPRKLPIPD